MNAQEADSVTVNIDNGFDLMEGTAFVYTCMLITLHSFCVCFLLFILHKPSNALGRQDTGICSVIPPFLTNTVCTNLYNIV